jgi:hypothetical protein
MRFNVWQEKWRKIPNDALNTLGKYFGIDFFSVLCETQNKMKRLGFPIQAVPRARVLI